MTQSGNNLVRVRGYVKPDSSFYTLDQWEEMARVLLALQSKGYDTRSGKRKNVLDFIEDFVNHRLWSFENQFGEYFPDIRKLRFAFFYSRGDMEPYVLLDEEYTEQLYGSLLNPKELNHYTTEKGLLKLYSAIKSGEDFDISTFTVANRPFFRPESNVIVTLVGNVRAGFRSDVKSYVVDSGRRACNMHRLGYPGSDDNICYELDTCDGDVQTSLWNEYIATPLEIKSVSKVV